MALPLLSIPTAQTPKEALQEAINELKEPTRKLIEDLERLPQKPPYVKRRPESPLEPAFPTPGEPYAEGVDPSDDEEEEEKPFATTVECVEIDDEIFASIVETLEMLSELPKKQREAKTREVTRMVSEVRRTLAACRSERPARNDRVRALVQALRDLFTALSE